MREAIDKIILKEVMWQTHPEAMSSNKKIAFDDIQYFAQHFSVFIFPQIAAASKC